jgi:thiosulfate dehydrogenase [quinone] large subunit
MVKPVVEPALEEEITPEMVAELQQEAFAWKKAYFKRHPVKGTLIGLFLALRIFYGLFFFYAFWLKFKKHWMTSDVMQKFFKQRYQELGPDSVRGRYLKYFAIPFYKPVAWVLVPSQLAIALGMISGTATRKNGALSLFILLNIAAGGYGDRTLPPFIAYAVLATALPSGQWMGFDRKLQKRYPNSALFR